MATTSTASEMSNRASHSVRMAFPTCSQLSRKTNGARSAMATTAAAADSKPSVPATASGPAPTGRSLNQPAMRSAPTRLLSSGTTSATRRVLPTPPGPTTVSRPRWVWASRSRARSASRPKNPFGTTTTACQWSLDGAPGHFEGWSRHHIENSHDAQVNRPSRRHRGRTPSSATVSDGATPRQRALRTRRTAVDRPDRRGSATRCRGRHPHTRGPKRCAGRRRRAAARPATGRSAPGRPAS